MTENTQQELFIRMVLDAWQTKAVQFGKLLDSLTEEQLQHEVAPGRNRGIYLAGHLTALGNSILPLLGAENVSPHLLKPFAQTPDLKNDDLPSLNELRQEWTKINERLNDTFAATSPDEWFRKHTAVSEEDFAREPHRNKLNVILSRVGHMDYHLGQLAFLVKHR